METCDVLGTLCKNNNFLIFIIYYYYVNIIHSYIIVNL